MIRVHHHHLVVPLPAVEGRDFAHERVRAHVVPPLQLRFQSELLPDLVCMTDTFLGQGSRFERYLPIKAAV